MAKRRKKIEEETVQELETSNIKDLKDKVDLTEPNIDEIKDKVDLTEKKTKVETIAIVKNLSDLKDPKKVKIEKNINVKNLKELKKEEIKEILNKKSSDFIKVVTLNNGIQIPKVEHNELTDSKEPKINNAYFSHLM